MDKTITLKKTPMIIGVVCLIIGQVIGGWIMDESAKVMIPRIFDTAFYLIVYSLLLWNVWSEK